MGIEAVTRTRDGSRVTAPTSWEEWDHWVSAGRTRNWMLQDPLLDWLDRYGRNFGYLQERDLRGYNRNLDFLQFIFERGHAFEAGILRLFQAKYDVVTIANDFREIRRLNKAEETFEALQEGVPVVYQAVLWDAHESTYGSPDFLIRSDVLYELFPESFSMDDARASAPDIGARGWHYLVVDSKFTTLHLNAAGTEIGNGGSAPAYKAQLYLYNRMLGRLQGFEPPSSYLLGRGWQQGQGSGAARGSSALERLGPVVQAGTVANGKSLAEAVQEALGWIRRVRTEGENWRVLPEPSVPELYPNMSGPDSDLVVDLTAPELEPGYEEEGHLGEWTGVKKWLTSELKELTQLWQVGVRGRREAHNTGIYRWDDPDLTPAVVGVNGPTNSAVLAHLLSVNAGGAGPLTPSRITALREEWHAAPAVEFYVDFEFCSDLNDDFANLPEKGGQPLIFMIGCGHLENEGWEFSSFTVNRLCQAEELRIIREWVAHMGQVRDRLDPANTVSRVIHWSQAEPIALERAYNSARARHGADADWPEPGWFDFLRDVMRKEPVVVRGALAFGLKAVANAMHSHGMVATNWEDSLVDGLGAMVGAWRCDETARRDGLSMTGLPLMDEIARYNEVDCKVMMEIVRYLRSNH